MSTPIDQWPKYIRLLVEFEVEVTDPVAVIAATQPGGYDQEGNEVMFDAGEPEWAAALAHQLILPVRGELADEVGMKWINGSVLPRPRDGERYPPFTLPELPVRRDDGTMPGWETPPGT